MRHHRHARHGWGITTHRYQDGSVTARVTRWHRVMGRSRSRTVTYRLPPGSGVPRTARQAERAAARVRSQSVRIPKAEAIRPLRASLAAWVREGPGGAAISRMAGWKPVSGR
jgi:hypothetical protein